MACGAIYRREGLCYGSYKAFGFFLFYISHKSKIILKIIRKRTTFFNKGSTIALMLKNLNEALKLAIFDNGNITINPRELIVWMESGCLLSITPILVMYIFLQKNFTEGIARSGLTGM